MTKFSKEEKGAIQAAIDIPGLTKPQKEILSQMIQLTINYNNSADIYVDGASDLHSKTAGIGGAIFQNGIEIYSFAEPLIDKTNNEAEYMSMIKGIQGSLELNILNLNI